MSSYKFEDLTWDDLTAWAGARVVKRGKSYLTSVEDLCVTTDGRLLAWVYGTDRYATVVSLPDKGKPDSVCTCPYGIACKHAVATVLAYLEAVKANKEVPLAEKDDDRFEEDTDFEEDDLEEAAPTTSRTRNKDEVGAYLNRLSKDELLHIFHKAMDEIPDLRKKLANRLELASTDVTRLVKSARRAIREASAEPGWKRHWSHESYIPDYTPVRERLQALLKAGHADEVVALGEELIRVGLNQIGGSDDEGETGQEVAECVGIVFQALKQSSMPDADKLLWEQRARLREDYGFFDGLPSLWKNGKAFSTAVWSEVADKLLKEVPPMSQSKPGSKADSDSHSVIYERENIMHAVYEALKWAGRADEVTDLLRREADITQCYDKLVDHLSSLGLYDEADEWCRKGFAATIEKLPGIANDLARRLRDRAQQENNRPLVAAFLVAEFIDRPSVKSFETLEKATAPLGHWETVRTGMLRWLETGRRPDATPARATSKTTKQRGRKAAAPGAPEPHPAWPLPDTGLVRVEGRNIYSSFPQRQLLLEIAIYEKRHDDALAWFAQISKHSTVGWGYTSQLGPVVAKAVQETHPDAALDIWKQQVDAEIATVNPAAYEVAGGYLAKMKVVYTRLGREAEWTALIAELRAKNRPKRRLTGVLDQLEGIRKKPGKIIG